MERHPLSAIWPDMDQEDKAKLLKDVSQNGVLEPVVTLDGMVLDGWHRYRAAVIAGVDCKVVEYDGDAPADFVISKNDMRRHISKQQRAKAHRLCLEWQASVDAGADASASLEQPTPEQEHDQATSEVLDKDKASDEQALSQVEVQESAPESPESTESTEPIETAPGGVTHQQVADSAGVSLQTARRAYREIQEERGENPTPEKPAARTETIIELRGRLENAEVIRETQASRIQELAKEAEGEREMVRIMREELNPEDADRMDVIESQKREIESLKSEVQSWQTSHEEQRKTIESLRSQVQSYKRRIAELQEVVDSHVQGDDDTKE